MEVRSRNTARDSQLHRFGVFEYVPLQEALGVPALQAIAVPLTAGELPLLLDNLALWHTPAFRPLRSDSPLCGKVDLRQFFDVDPSAEILPQVQAAWAMYQTGRGSSRGRVCKDVQTSVVHVTLKQQQT